MLLLTNEEVEQVLDMGSCIEILEQTYQALAENRAINIPRADMLVPTSRPEVIHGFKTMSGSIPQFGITALRINSDVINWPKIDGEPRRVKIPAAGTGKWVGLVFLFQIETGEPIAMMPDGVIQRMRVGATNGIGAKFLSRVNAETVAMLGSGWQAGAQLMAITKVRNIKKIIVFSPTRDNRVRFAREMEQLLETEVTAAESAEQAVENADVIMAATNALHPVIKKSHLKPGVHITCVRQSELDAESLAHCDIVTINTRMAEPDHYVLGKEEDIPEITGFRGLEKKAGKSWWQVPELSDVIGGKTRRRENESEITCFINNLGLGVQFAAVGAKVYELAKKQGLGRDLPADWFLQSVHP
jgi:ornithine cyclodeaminase/alanine dehydrogenase-like protein (mu-crystallin family)